MFTTRALLLKAMCNQTDVFRKNLIKETLATAGSLFNGEYDCSVVVLHQGTWWIGKKDTIEVEVSAIKGTSSFNVVSVQVDRALDTHTQSLLSGSGTVELDRIVTYMECSHLQATAVYSLIDLLCVEELICDRIKSAKGLEMTVPLREGLELIIEEIA